MRLVLVCLAAFPIGLVPAAVAADPLSPSAFLASGATSFDVVSDPDLGALAVRDARSFARDDATVVISSAGETRGGGEAGGAERPDTSFLAPLRVTSTLEVRPEPAPRRTRAITPARTTAAQPAATTVKAFRTPWQTGIFQ